MALWCDKDRPRSFSRLRYNQNIGINLTNIVKVGDFPHVLIYGPNGAGKKTLITCILRELYGTGSENIKRGTQYFQTISGRRLELQTFTSNYHIQLKPSEVGVQDRLVVQEVIKDMAQTKQINPQAQKHFKVVVLMEVDALTRDAQDALRRTMEKYAATCRLILCCESLNKVSEPLRSRCTLVRIPAPSDEEVLELQLHSNNVSLNEEIVGGIVKKVKGNMRLGLLLAQAAANYRKDQKIFDLDWEVYIRETAKLILRDQTSECLLKVRERIYECLAHCIPADTIFVKLVRELLPYCDGQIKAEVVAAAAKFEHRLGLGSKAIFHIEAFIATFMAVYYRQLKECTEDL
uniref:AAA domain-containing protein n=1 Tax=Syphacia muris TaxID=451379 RepID=A0A0N5AW48_9BILA